MHPGSIVSDPRRYYTKKSDHLLSKPRLVYFIFGKRALNSSYSFTSLSPLSHWIDTNLFGGGHDRVVFDVSGGPARARLRIYNVSEADDGIYREDQRTAYIARKIASICVFLAAFM